MIETRKLKDFANMNDWLVINESGPKDVELGDRFIKYLTPAGRIVMVRFNKDGSVKEVVSV